MKMQKVQQIVYVVTDISEQVIIGAFNTYMAAKIACDSWQDEYNQKYISITPVLVDSACEVDMCYTEQDVFHLTNSLMNPETDEYNFDDDDDDNSLEEIEMDDYDANDNCDFDDDDEEEDDENDSCQYSLTVKGEFALRLMEAGNSFEKACEVADLLFGEGDGE